MQSSEETARAAFAGLSGRDKLLVQSWRELGNDWFTSMVNSGVLRSNSNRRMRPYDYEHAIECERLAQSIAEDYERAMPPTEESRRREACEHEAGHIILAQSFGLPVRLSYVLRGGAGNCLYDSGTPFQTAAVALAGEIWIGTFRARDFPRGPTGCQADRRAAVGALNDDMQLRKAYNHAYETLRANHSAVLAVAAKLERDGNYIP